VVVVLLVVFQVVVVLLVVDFEVLKVVVVLLVVFQLVDVDLVVFQLVLVDFVVFQLVLVDLLVLTLVDFVVDFDVFQLVLALYCVILEVGLFVLQVDEVVQYVVWEKEQVLPAMMKPFPFTNCIEPSSAHIIPWSPPTNVLEPLRAPLVHVKVALDSLAGQYIV